MPRTTIHARTNARTVPGQTGFASIVAILVPAVIMAASLFVQTFIRAADDLDFSGGSGTQDAGAVASYDGPKTWTVTLPSDFTKVETIHYDKGNPSNERKYMGWEGSLTANGSDVWRFKSWASSTGGIIYDGALGQDVRESTGIGQWIDATQFFRAGSNTVVFAHNTGGSGIGLKIRVTATGAPLSGSASEPPPPSEPSPSPKEQVILYSVNDTIAVDEFGGAEESLQVSFPKEVWDETMKRSPLTPKVLGQIEEEAKALLRRAGFVPRKVKAAAVQKQRTIALNIEYTSYAYPASHFNLSGVVDRWIIKPIGVFGLENPCRADTYDVQVNKKDVLVRATCDQVISGPATVIRSRYDTNQMIRLPASASNIAYDTEQLFVAYQITKVSDGGACKLKSDCASGNCRRGRCCMNGKNCCWPTEKKTCPTGQYCSSERFACVPTLENGNTCTSNSECESGRCGKNICCTKGKNCCTDDTQCGVNEFCEAWDAYACIAQKENGKKCGQPRECKSGYCEKEKCAKAPASVSFGPTERGPAEAVMLVAPSSLSLYKAERRSPAIRIQNSGEDEVILLENVTVRNSNPDVVGVNQSALRIIKGAGAVRSMATGDVVGTESDDLLSSIETLTLTGKKQGQSDIELRAGYTVSGQTKWLTAKVRVTVSGINIQRESSASTAFGEDMLYREKRTVRDASSGKSREYVFVEPEDDASYQASIGIWKLAQETFDGHLANLADDFKGAVTPDILSFFDAVEKMRQAKTPGEITEEALRAIAPSVITGAFDFLRMGAAAQRLEMEERAFLNRFNATEFSRIPLLDAKGKTIGFSKAVVKERGGKRYAVKIGDY